MVPVDSVVLPRYSDLTEPQRQVIQRLAEAEISDPPAWLPLPLNRLTVRKLVNLDLVVLSDGQVHITGRGLLYYRRWLAPAAPKPHRFPDDLVRRIIQLSRAGVSQYAIAEQLGCTQSYVSAIIRGRFPRARRLLAEAGQQPTRKVIWYPDSVRRQVIRLRRAGASYQEIAATTGCAHGTIGRWCQQAGLRTEGWLSDEEKRAIVRMALDGMTNQAIADAIGRSVRPVKDALKAWRLGVLKLTNS